MTITSVPSGRGPLRIAFIGNSPPRRCGIATFTADLQQALASLLPAGETCIVAMTDNRQIYDYPPIVGFQIHDKTIDDYANAAEFLNFNRFDVACLQHEFGIFGGRDGNFLLGMLSRLTMPLVTTLHTVLADPTPSQRDALEQIVALSAKVVVMAEKGRELLTSVYGVAQEKIEIVPHGVPDSPFVEPDAAKAEFGFSDKPVILTFGLLSPNKGIEAMIDAMPSILERCGDATYVVLGATHPNLIRQQGEAYRESLEDRVRKLGLEEHVTFVDRFVDQATLLRYIAMCDVYVTPYLNEAQMTSGSLAYSFGLGKAVVSTPYWHASELLAEGRGLIVPFGDVAATAAAVSGLLTDDFRRDAMRKRAYATSRSMTWEHVAQRYADIFQSAVAERLANASSPTPPGSDDLPQMRFSHLSTMCDDTGLYQHALHSVPDRTHGYCVDDNARGLLLACTLSSVSERFFPKLLASRFAAFIQHAWNRDTGRLQFHELRSALARG